MSGPRYAIIPADAVTDDSLTGPDFRVLALLGKHIDRAGWCTRAQGRMAEELGIARKTLQRSLTRLVEAGYVEVRHKTRRDGGQAANEYRVVLDDAARADQLDLFGREKTSPAKPARARQTPTPASRMTPPHGHSGDAPPASPGCPTHKERPLQETTPSDSGKLRCLPARHANDDRPAEVIQEAGAVPLRRPPQPAAEPAAQVPSWTRAQTDALNARLRDAAGASINSASPGFLVLAEPIGWLAAGCDLELDVLPAVAGLAARSRGSPIRSWSYFAGAVREARDRRIEMAKPAGAGSPNDPRSSARGGDPHAQRSRRPKGDRSSPGRRSSADRFSDAFRDVFSDVYCPEDA